MAEKRGDATHSDLALTATNLTQYRNRYRLAADHDWDRGQPQASYGLCSAHVKEFPKWHLTC